MARSNVYFVILAGGNGERLWPLSRQHKPKQLLEIGSGKSLLEQAVSRVTPISQSTDKIWVVTTKNHESEIKKCVGNSVGSILVEPASRNTGPAILYCCFELYKRDPNATVVFLPADPFIPTYENEKFCAYLSQAIHFVQEQQYIALLGVKPTYPATGYGYIQCDSDTFDAQTGLYRVASFQEKPPLERAQHYIQQKNMLWNIGMFCAQVKVFIDEFKQHAPDIFHAVDAYMQQTMDYEAISAQPVDCAVMERSNRVWVLPVDFAWCDVGNIGVFLSLKQEYAGLEQNLVAVDATNNLVDVPDKLVALVGVDDLCVVQTEDALLITKFDQAEKVRSIVNQLKERNDRTHL